MKYFQGKHHNHPQKGIYLLLLILQRQNVRENQVVGKIQKHPLTLQTKMLQAVQEALSHQIQVKKGSLKSQVMVVHKIFKARIPVALELEEHQNSNLSLQMIKNPLYRKRLKKMLRIKEEKHQMIQIHVQCKISQETITLLFRASLQLVEQNMVNVHCIMVYGITVSQLHLVFSLSLNYHLYPHISSLFIALVILISS